MRSLPAAFGQDHDWTAREGDFVYEPPGEVHTKIRLACEHFERTGLRADYVKQFIQ